MANTPRTVLPAHGTNRSRTVFVPHGGVPNVPTPVFTTDPYMVGITTVGETLAVYAGVVEPTPQVIEYQIFRGSEEVPGADQPFYTLTVADIGFTIKARVRAELDGKITEKFTPPTPVVKAAEPPEVAPTFAANPKITGTPLVGNLLVCDIGQITGFPVPIITYRLLANGVSVAAGTINPPANNINYTIALGDFGKAFTFEVTATNSEGSATATSAPTGVVTSPATPGVFEIQSNLSGMETGNRWDTFTFKIENSMLDDYYARGFRTIRLPLKSNRMQEYPFGPLDTDYLTTYLKPVIDYAASKGMRLILDDHTFGARSFETAQAPSTQLNDTAFNTGWSTFQGTAVADGLIENTATNTHSLQKTVTVPAGTVTVSARVQVGSKPWLRLIFRKGSDRAVLVDMANGVEIVNPASTAVTSVTQVSPGVFDLTITMADETAGSATLIFEAGNASADYASYVSAGRSYTGDGVSQPIKVVSINVATQTVLRKSYQYGSPELPNAAAGDMFGKLAAWLIANVDMAGVHGFDFMNEPYQWSADQCYDYMKTCIQAVRAVPGFDKWLYIEGIPFSGARTFWALNPNHHLLTQYDPLNKLIFSVHVYPDWNSSGANITFPSQGDAAFGVPLEEGPPGAVVDDFTAVNRLIPFIQGCEARGVRGHIGEIGIDNTTKLGTQGQINVLELCQDHGIEYCHWAGGPTFNESYFYNLNRRTSDGLQPFQQAVYDEYFGNGSPTIYGLSGPTQLALGQSTATFTVRYHGLIKTGTTRVTFSDNGGGGSFNPTFVDLDSTYNNGYNAVATTVYTPNGDQLVQISCTNNAGWTDPPAITFASEDDFMSLNGIDPASAVNIWNPQRIVVRTYSGPLVRLRRADGVESDFGAVGVGYNTANVGAELDTAAITTWAAGQTYTEVICYDQSGNGRDRHAATTEKRVPTVSEQPAFIIDGSNNGKPVTRYTTASKQSATSTLNGSTGHTVIIVAKYNGGKNFLEWQTSYSGLTIGPGVNQTWKTTALNDPFANTKPNERGSMPLPMQPGEWHVYGVHWQKTKTDGWRTYRDSERIASCDTWAASLNMDYSRSDVCIGYTRYAASSGLLTADVAAVYVFRDSTSANTRTLTEAQILAIHDDELTYQGITEDPTDLETYLNTFTPAIDYDFVNNVYKENGVVKSLTDIGTSTAGSLTRDSTGLLVNSANTITWSTPVLNAILASNFTFSMAVGAQVFSASNKPVWMTSTGGGKTLTLTTASNTNSTMIWSNTGLGGLSGSSTGNPASSYDNFVTLCQNSPTTAAAVGSGDYYKSGGGWNLAGVTSVKSSASGTVSFRVRRLRIFPTYLKRDYVDALIYSDGVMPPAGTDLPNFYMGVNLSGPEFSGTSFWSRDEEIDYWYNKMGPAVCFRVPIKTNRLVPVMDGAFDTTQLDNLDRLYAKITSKVGAKLVIDMHEYGKSPYDTGLSIGGVGATYTSAKHAAFLARLGTRYPLAWLSFNEPNGSLTKIEWIAVLTEGCAAWRAAGATGVFLIGGYGSVQAGRRIYLDKDSFLTFSDPLNNWAIENHNYFDGDTSGTSDVSNANSGGYWQSGDAYALARKYGWRIFVGEWGLGRGWDHGAAMCAGWRYLTRMTRLYRDVALGQTIWAGGRAWPTTYLYAISPDAVTNSATNQLTWTNKPYGEQWQASMMRQLRDLSYETEVINPPEPPDTTVTFTPGAEYNVSAIAADLTNVYELNAAADPTNTARQVVTGRYGPGTTTNVSVVFVTTDNWTTVTKTVLSGDAEPVPHCDHLGNFYIVTNADGTLGRPSGTWVRKIPAGTTTLGAPVSVGSYTDRIHLHVDRSVTSARRGRIYCGGRQSGGLRIYRSDDGVTWSSTLIGGDADFNAGFLYGITTAPDGTVYATYSGRNNIVTSGGVYAGSNQSHYCVKSTDGGVTWTTTFVFKNQETVATGNGVGYRTWAGNIAVNPVTGRLHFLISQGASDYQKKQYFTSDDGGATWTNNGPLNLTLPSGWGPGHHFLECNKLGYLCLGFYAINSSYSSNRYYVLGSKDDGVTWNGLTKVNTTDFPSASGQRGVIGEDRNYGCVAADGAFLIPFLTHLTGDNKYAARVRKMSIVGGTYTPDTVTPTGPPIYYFSTSGNNANDGLTTSTPKQTIAHLNTLTLAPGTTVKFNGGQTFSGSITGKSGVIYTSYGTGRATINAGSGHGIDCYNIAAIVDGLNFTGDGTAGKCGVIFYNDSATRWIPGVRIANVTASGFGLCGILASGDATPAGYDSLLIENCVTFGNCTASAGGAGSSGIFVGNDGYYTEASGPAHISPVIRNCLSYSNPGASDTNWTGSGIFMYAAQDGLIEKCVAYENGALASVSGGGPAGIWIAGCKNTVIQYCESYSNHRALSGGGDGDGFDIDGGCWDCTIQYCYSHDNDGAGYLIYNYTDAALQAHNNNTVRFCVSEDDGVNAANNFSAGITAAADADMTNFKVYGNTVFQSRASKYCVSVWKNGTLSGTIANNIFYGTGTSSLINTRLSSNPDVTIRGNSWFHTGTFSMRNGGTNYTSYAAWQTATSHELVSGTNVGKTVDPGLTTPGSGGTIFPAITSTSSIVWTPTTQLAAYRLTAGSASRGAGRNLSSEFGITPPAVTFYGSAYAQNIGAD